MGSRITWVVSGAGLMVLGVLGKFGAMLACLPDPVLGGINIATIGMIVSVGLSHLKHVDLESRRNLLILAVSFMTGMAVPFWLIDNPNAIKTGTCSFAVRFWSNNIFGGIEQGIMLHDSPRQ